MRVWVSALFTVIALQSAAELKFEPHSIPRRGGDPIEAEVATLSVPSRRSVPGSPSFQLAVLRLRSTSESPGDPIVYLAGGPGNPGTAYAGSPAVQLLRSAGDVLLFDQRGTGRSTPSPLCRSTRPPDPAVVYSDERALTNGFVALIRDCAAEWAAKGYDTQAFTTEESADDVEALRRALGVPRVNIVGFSYGTHLALSVLRRHGAHVGRAVLLGTEGPDDTWKYPETLDLQLVKLSHLARGSDAMVRSFDRVMRQLDRKPVVVRVHLDDHGESPVDVKVSRFGLERILIQDLGDSSDFVLFPAMLEMLEQGDTSLLARYVEKRYRALTRGIPLMSVAMDCASGATPERLSTIGRQAAKSRFPRINHPYPGVCAQLGFRALGEDFRSALVSTVPALFVSGSLDYQTPPHQAERTRWGFTDSSHLVVIHGGHEDLDTSREVGRAVVDFLGGKNIRSGVIEAPRPVFLTVEEVRERLRR